MNLIDAAKQMVEAVEKADGNEISRGFFSPEITNLRAAIEAAEKVEPVAFRTHHDEPMLFQTWDEASLSGTVILGERLMSRRMTFGRFLTSFQMIQLFRLCTNTNKSIVTRQF